MSNMVTIRNYLVYLDYTYSVFNPLISEVAKSPRYLNKPVARSVRFFFSTYDLLLLPDNEG